MVSGGQWQLLLVAGGAHTSKKTGARSGGNSRLGVTGQSCTFWLDMLRLCLLLTNLHFLVELVACSLGRDDDNDIHFDSKFVTHFHATIFLNSDRTCMIRGTSCCCYASCLILAVL